MMMELRIKSLEQKRSYQGPELRPHFILSETQIEGNALIAFRGPCDVKTDHLVDWEDRLVKDHIKASEMVHFLGEFFGVSLLTGVFFQRLFVSILKDELAQYLPGEKLIRRGDDLYYREQLSSSPQEFKLTVSIVTSSAVSCLFHLGLNVNATGAPVKAKGLQDLGFNDQQIEDLIEKTLNKAQSEWKSIALACTKVRPV